MPCRFWYRITCTIRSRLDALGAGCHVLLEKPFALTLAEANDLIAEAEGARQNADDRAAASLPQKHSGSSNRLIDSGEYGRLFMLDAFMDEDNREYITGGWFVKKATLGGGVFFSASAHMLDVMLWIAGDVQSVPRWSARTPACRWKAKIPPSRSSNSSQWRRRHDPTYLVLAQAASLVHHARLLRTRRDHADSPSAWQSGGRRRQLRLDIRASHRCRGGQRKTKCCSRATKAWT